MLFKTSPSNDILIRAVSLNHVPSPSAPAVSWNDSATMQIYANNADIVQSKYRYSPSALSTFGTSHHAEATEAVGKVKRIAPRCLRDQWERFCNNANADSTVQIPIQIQSISISVVDIRYVHHTSRKSGKRRAGDGN